METQALGTRATSIWCHCFAVNISTRNTSHFFAWWCLYITEGVAYQAPPPYPGLDDPSLKVPPVVVCLPGKKVGRVSPLMDEWEGQTVREELHQGWVLSEVTRNQLENPSRHAHKLTCPALMSDIKLVKGSYIKIL